jgi:hypothetical protein
MQSLIDILNHPALVLNRVAETVYDGQGPAVHQRLRSRAQQRHRFSVADYKALRKHLLAFSRRLDVIAERLEASQEVSRPDWLKLMHHPWLNHKYLLTQLGAPHQLSYLQVYDGMRGRIPLPEALPLELAQQYRQLALWLREQLELAKEARKTYPFSQGRGGGSHRKG